MSVQTTSLPGGESVYCINETQLKEAVRLTESDPASAPRLQQLIAQMKMNAPGTNGRHGSSRSSGDCAPPPTEQNRSGVCAKEAASICISLLF